MIKARSFNSSEWRSLRKVLLPLRIQLRRWMRCHSWITSSHLCHYCYLSYYRDDVQECLHGAPSSQPAGKPEDARAEHPAVPGEEVSISSRYRFKHQLKTLSTIITYISLYTQASQHLVATKVQCVFFSLFQWSDIFDVLWIQSSLPCRKRKHSLFL